MRNAIRRLPVVVTDIDGVLVRGGTPVHGVGKAISRIVNKQLPFFALTNGGGQL